MKRILSILFFLMMALPRLAHAQYYHASFFNGSTTLTATCTNTSGSYTSSDVFLGTAQGNTTVTLPAASSNCLDYDIIDLRFTQAASQSYTLTVNAGASSQVKIISNGGVLLAAPTGAASGAVNVLHQIWVHDAVATTDTWELVTQETGGVSGITVNGGIAQTGSSFVTAIGTPSAPSIVSGFTGGTTDYYFCVAGDVNATTGGVGTTIPSAGTGTTGTTGTMSCGGQTGTMIYYLLRKLVSAVPSGTSTFLVGSCTTTSGVACDVADAGNTLTTFTANIGDLTGSVRLSGTATSAPYLVVTEGTAASTSVMGPVPGFTTLDAGLWLGIAPVSTSITNYTLEGNSATTNVNAASASVNLQSGGTTYFTTSSSGSGTTTTPITSTTGAIGPTGGGVLQSYGGTAPTLTAGCNGSGASAITGTNTHGHFTTQTAAATTCTVTFSASGAFHAAPDCVFYDNNADATPLTFSTGAISTTTAVVDFSSLTATDIGYICIGS